MKRSDSGTISAQPVRLLGVKNLRACVVLRVTGRSPPFLPTTARDTPFIALRAHAVLMYVLDDLDLRHGNQPLIYHLVQVGDKLLYFILGIDNADHNG